MAASMAQVPLTVPLCGDDTPRYQLEHEVEALLSAFPLFQAFKHSQSKNPLATLIHAIQRERGSTAVWIANGGRLFLQEVLRFRGDTDTVLAEMDRSSIHSIHLAIQVLRERSGLSVKAPPCGESFYISLCAYTSLIKVLLAVQEKMHTERGREHLTTIAHLKETSAFQRGILSSILSLPSSAISSLPVHCSVDFMRSLHWQRSFVAHLETTVPLYWLRKLAVSLRLDGTELSWLNEKSVTLFDEQTASKEARVQYQWHLHTRHVDRLHAGELELSELHLPVSQSCSIHPNPYLPPKEMRHLRTENNLTVNMLTPLTCPRIPAFLYLVGEVITPPLREPSLLIDLTILRGHDREKVGQLLPAMFDERNPRGLPATLREIEVCIHRQDDARAHKFTRHLFAQSQAESTAHVPESVYPP